MLTVAEILNMKDIYLIGEERYMYDFRYVFDDFNVKRLFTDVDEMVHLERNERTLLIVCARVGNPIKLRLEETGYVYGETLLLAEDIFELFLNQNRRIVVWGVGHYGKQFIEAHKDEIEFAVDCGTALKEDICGKKIYKPSEVDLSNHFIVVATGKYWPEIKVELQTLGFREDMDFAYFQGYVNLREMMLDCVNRYPIADVNCHLPFDFCQIIPGGYVNLCCLGMKIPAGGVKEQSFQDVWQSRRAKILRLSVINKTFCFCDAEPCPVIKTSSKYDYAELFRPSDYDVKTMFWPKEVNVSIDHSCNLYCEHCRKELLVAKGNEKEEISKIADKLDDVLSNAEILVLAGNGEVFFSDVYKKMWKGSLSGNRTSIGILTNGILFSANVWNELQEKFGKIGISVSIDAATEETYKKIRRGGNFKLLQKNMAFAGKLRRNGELSYFHMNFVIRQDNAGELKDFILWAKEIGADRVRVSKVENWVYDSTYFYNSISVFNVDNSLKPEFSNIFADKIFAESGIEVEMINIKL